MPAHFPEFPHHSEILKYFRAYADHFGLHRCIEYSRAVSRIEPFADGQAWDVHLENGEFRRFRALVIANGHNWSPKWPNYPGHFSGQVLHTAQYKTPDVLAGKRVLVVGGGNSGCDLAVEAAQNARRAVHSTRRSYHYVPKFIMGRPVDRLGDKLLKWRLPLGLRRWISNLLLKIVAGSPKRFKLPRPDHKLYETHPIINSLLLYYLGHGDISPKPDIDKLDGATVHFVDGTYEEFDLIIYATGYQIAFPFIDNQWLNWRDGRPCLYNKVFHPTYDNLFVAGMIQPDSGQFGLVDWQMKAVATFLRAIRDGSAAADFLRQLKKDRTEDLGSGIEFKDSTRHYLEVEHWSYRQGLEKLVSDMNSLRTSRRVGESPAAHVLRYRLLAGGRRKSRSNPLSVTKSEQHLNLVDRSGEEVGQSGHPGRHS